MCLLAIHISSFVMCPFKYFVHFVSCCSFSFYWVVRILNIWEKIPSSYIYKYFLLFLHLSLIFLNVFLEKQKLFIWWSPIQFFLMFFVCWLVGWLVFSPVCVLTERFCVFNSSLSGNRRQNSGAFSLWCSVLCRAVPSRTPVFSSSRVFLIFKFLNHLS